jgi:ADP-ribose pyrophosphatase
MSSCLPSNPHGGTRDSIRGDIPAAVLQQKLYYKGRKFDFEVNTLQLPNGVMGDWECIRHPGGALVVPVTAEGKLVMIRQYRFAARGYLLEFPAGTLEPGEEPAQTIEREIQEETGYRAKTWRSLGQFFLAPGYSDEIIYVFLATDLEQLAVPPAQDEDEMIEVVLLSPQELEAAIHGGQVPDTRAISSYLLAKPFLPVLEGVS